MSPDSTHALPDGLRRVPVSDWPALAARFADYNYRQTHAYSVHAARRHRASVEPMAIVSSGKIIALACVRVRTLPFVGGGIAYISGGPLVTPIAAGSDTNSATLTSALSHLRAEYTDRRALHLRVLPPLGTPDASTSIAETFERAGFRSTTRIPPYHTLLLNLTPPLNDLRRSLRRNWRNHLKRALSPGLALEHGSSPTLFDAFVTLYSQMRSRKAFDVSLDAAFYRDVQTELPPPEQLQVCIARLSGTPVAGCVYSILGNTCVYLLGATIDEGLKTRASYLLQWHTIETARAAGCLYYDLGGIDPQGNPGVYDFKAGMGGRDASAPGPFELRASGLRANLSTAAESACRLRGFRSLAGLRSAA